MGDYRSKSYANGRMQMKSHYGSRPCLNRYDFHSYSASYASYPPPPPPALMGGRVRVFKVKKGKSTRASYNDLEFQRKKKVTSYKVYMVEGKVKESLRKSFRWLKNRYTQVVNG